MTLTTTKISEKPPRYETRAQIHHATTGGWYHFDVVGFGPDKERSERVAQALLEQGAAACKVSLLEFNRVPEASETAET